MPVTKVPQKYQTADGREFDAPEEAERHDAIVVAKQRFDDAKEELMRALCHAQKTADGHPFKFGGHDYYYITGLIDWPRIGRVTFYHSWNQTFEIDPERDDEVVLIDRQHLSGDDFRHRSFRISELYWDKAAAMQALVQQQEEYIAGRRKELAEIKAGREVI